MPRAAYIAHPIDFVQEVDLDNMAHQVAHALAGRGWIVYSPAMAWSLDPKLEPGPEIEAVNRFALGESGLLVALLPAGVPTHGTLMEIEYACMRGIQAVVWCDRPGWALAASDAVVYTNISELMAELPHPSQVDPPYEWTIKFQVGEGGRLPTRTHQDDVGYDLYSSQDVTIAPGGFADIPTQVRVVLPTGVWANIVGRSSTWRTWGLHAVSGVIDGGYRGELFSAAQNPGPEPVFIPAGSRLTQLILHSNLAIIHDPIAITPEEFEAMPGDGRGSAGFGSSGL